MANPLAVPLRLVWTFPANNSGHGPSYTTSIALALDELPADRKGVQAYFFYINEGVGRVPIHRLTARPGYPFATSIHKQRGIHEHLEFLGYVSSVKLDGMVKISLPWVPFLVDDSCHQSGFIDYERRVFYAYPATGEFVSPHTASTSKDLPQNTLEYESANYKHFIEIGRSPHITRWRIIDEATGLNLDMINTGGGNDGDLTVGGGTGRGVQIAFGFQDFEGFEGSDPADNVCITVHNPTQAGSQSGNDGFFTSLDTGATQANSIVVDKAIGDDSIDLLVIPMDFIEGPPFGVSTPYPTPPAPCASEWHGQPGFGDDDSGAALWETLRMRQFLELDIEGREGVHRITYEFYTPVDIVSVAQTAGDTAAVNLGATTHLNEAFLDAYSYDPVNHTSGPIHLNPYVIPTAALGNAGCTPPKASASINAYQDLWDYKLFKQAIQGTSRVNDVPGAPCPFCSDVCTHIWGGAPSTTEPKLLSGKGGVFLKSRFPAAAAANDKFGIGFVSTIEPTGGPWTAISYGKFRSSICFPLSYQVVDPFTVTFKSLGAIAQFFSPVGGTVTWPAGTFTAVSYYITDTYARFQGHVDWLLSEGLI